MVNEPSAEEKARAEFLTRELNHHNYLYHTLDKPEISDEQYDRLFAELAELESRWPQLRAVDSPTLRIGGAVLSNLEKKPHTRRMYGLDNVFSPEEWHSFLERIKRVWPDARELPKLEFWCDPKLDGLAVELTYQYGVLIQALTRGDGEIGEDVTAQARSIRNLPLSFLPNSPLPPLVEIRGEVVIFRKDFHELNERQASHGLKIFANPRNAAAGTLRQLDLSVTASRPLRFLAYGIGSADWGNVPACATQSALASQFVTWGFQVPPDGKLCATPSQVENYVEQTRMRRDVFPMEIDGAVAKLNDLQAQELLGFTARSPRYAVAFKFPALEARTKLLNIDVQVGRTGVLTPVAVLEPVSIAGVVVARATLHNENEIRLLDVRIGDTVILRRAGDVIPEIIGVDKGTRPPDTQEFRFPHVCPVCGQPVFREPNEAVWRCDNLACPARKLRSILHFSSALSIMGLGEKWLTQLVQADIVKSPADLFCLQKSQLEQFERMGPVLAQKIIDAIETAKKNATLPKLITALGILNVGEQTARELAQHYKNLENLAFASIDSLQNVPNVGPEVAASIRAFFDTPANKLTIRRLRREGLWPEEQETPSQSPLSGLTFLFTGTHSHPRAYYEERVRSAGGIVAKGVSRKLNYLVAGDNPGSKLEKAREAGIPIIDEQQFDDLLAKRMEQK